MMDIYSAHQPRIDAAWDAVEARIDGMPRSLAGAGRRFLESIRMEEVGHRSYFSSEVSPPLLYVSLWLRDRFVRDGCWPTDAPTDPSHRILLAGMWGYFYIRIQDDIIDGGDLTGAEHSLFGNVCIAEMYAHLHAATAGAASFWPAFERAWTDFTRFTLEEQHQVRSTGGYPVDLFVAHAQKVAFARIPPLAVCAVAGRLELEGAVDELVHGLGIAYGLVNDVLGWPRDVRSGQRTFLLARAGLARAELTEVATPNGPIVERLRGVLYDEGLLDTMLDETATWQRRAAEAGSRLGLPEMSTFTDERLRWLDEHRRRMQRVRLQRALAGARS